MEFPRSRSPSWPGKMTTVDRTTAQLQSDDLQKGPRKRPLLVLDADFAMIAGPRFFQVFAFDGHPRSGRRCGLGIPNPCPPAERPGASRLSHVLRAERRRDDRGLRR